MTEQATDLLSPPPTTMQEQTLARWNWGAFTFSWLWALGMRLWLVALPLLLINLGFYAVIAMQFTQGAATQEAKPSPLAQHAQDPHAGHAHAQAAAAGGGLELTPLVVQVLLAAAIVNVLASVVLGFMGSRLAWHSRNWNDLLHFRMTQMAWEKYGRPIGLVVLTVVPMYLILAKITS